MENSVSSPKRLLQINVCCNTLSTGKIASEIGELAIDDGWESYIAFSSERSFRPSRNIPIPIGSKYDYYTHVIESRLLDNEGFGFTSRKATENLLRKIEKINPSIIHLHILHGYYLYLPYLFNYLAKIKKPVVWTIHSCWEFTGHCGFFSAIGCDKWKKGCYRCPQNSNYPKSWIRDRSFKNFREKKDLFNKVQNMTLVPVSYWLCDVLKESFLKGHNIHPIYNGIDTDVFAPVSNVQKLREKLGAVNKTIVLGVASTWEPRKNMDDYLKLSNIVKENVLIVLVGLSEKQRINLPSNVIGLPRTSSDHELAELYSVADVVLNLSLEETFGLTTIEGFACGTPGVVYNCTASPELITDDTGFVVEVGDLQSVARNIERIREVGKHSYSNSCRLRAVSYFNKNKNFRQYLNLYNKLLV